MLKAVCRTKARAGQAHAPFSKCFENYQGGVTSCGADLTSWRPGADMTAVEATSRCAAGALSHAPVGVSGGEEYLRCQRTLVSSLTNCSKHSFSASTRPVSARWAEPGSQ